MTDLSETRVHHLQLLEGVILPRFERVPKAEIYSDKFRKGLAKRYINTEASEERAIQEQVSRLPQKMADDILTLIQDYEGRLSREGQLARDADLLECIIQAREYQVTGYPEAEDWIKNCYAGLRTDLARSLADACIHTEPGSWWKGLKIQ